MRVRMRLALGILLVVGSGCFTATSADHSQLLPNFSQVEVGIYRGGQPTDEGLRWLAKQGVKTVISLRYYHEGQPHERLLAEQLGLHWVNLPTRFWWRPNDHQVRQFLALALDPANRPVFVHCHRGQNRTGIMVAIYRIVHDGWSPQQAYTEARHFGMSWWNVMGRHLILDEAIQEFVPATARQ